MQERNFSFLSTTIFPMVCPCCAVTCSICVQGGSIVCEGREDQKDFNAIRSAMKVLAFSDTEVWDLFKVLAALLHVGNVQFSGKSTYVNKTSISSISTLICYGR